MLIRYISVLLLSSVLLAQLQYSGEINAAGLFQVDDASEIALPFRLMNLNSSYSMGDLEFTSVTAIEYRWNNHQSKLDLREMYLTWYPSFGEVSMGKQIFAWGMVDGNNPTDNPTAYDYHYLFKTGTDRKVGSLSASVLWYWDDWQLHSIFIPKHEPNRLVYDDDFPIQPPFKPELEDIISIGDEIEYGMRLIWYPGNVDLSFSWFSGHDRMFTPFIYTMEYNGNDIKSIPEKFGYRKTNVYSLDFSRFDELLTQRYEIAVFHTELKQIHDLEDPLFPDQNQNIEAIYTQFVFQFENTSFDDLTLALQLIGYEIILEDVEFTVYGSPQFQMGMGTPFAMLFQRALIVSATSTWLDNRLEIKPLLLTDLGNSGFMMGFSIEYNPYEQWTLEWGASLFKGSDKLPDTYIFNRLEEFSNFSLGLKYNF